MNISKLTISPVIKGSQSFTVKNPSKETAGLLMSERLTSGECNYTKKDLQTMAIRRLPKWIKNFVNVKSLVVDSKDFSTLA